jgi:CheY-like chemotaxis protein
VIYQEPIKALLLDISMPGIDGFELCRTVRSLPQFTSLPIIIITPGISGHRMDRTVYDIDVILNRPGYL